MISQKLIHLIEKHAEELTRRWLNMVRDDPDTMTYHRFPEDKLLDRASDVYRHLGRWIANEDRHLVQEFYTRLGAERFDEGFKLSEVVRALVLIRRNLESFIMEQGFLDSAIQLVQVLELINAMDLFFDRAVFYAVKGYETEAGLHHKLASAKRH